MAGEHLNSCNLVSMTVCLRQCVGHQYGSGSKQENISKVGPHSPLKVSPSIIIIFIYFLFENVPKYFSLSPYQR